ncbi:MAG: HAD-IA family hydrolase, partial [Planctomycetaceae bacterium]|jgi:glucose-1-phosphatase|nr:HAD-IA family hydrolase [Planctomycetaceae bacterium]MBT6460301.1 HAD-IA family hydrolase [Planctomycetaceae bacterium]MBT7729456.1 HAD-IA family hydrolase [Planctomycetaceae bacterium]
MKPPPQFIFLDAGNVLVSFDYAKGFRQISEQAGISPAQVKNFYTRNNLQPQLENGDLNWRKVHSAFCSHFSSDIPLELFSRAAGDIFTLNIEMLPVLAAIQRNTLRLGLLSNSCQPHWDHLCSSRYSLLPHAFTPIVLSHEVSAAKPDKKIYHYAQKKVRVPAKQIFFCDDLTCNVDAARSAGWDAEIFTTARKLIRDLNDRGVCLGM